VVELNEREASKNTVTEMYYRDAIFLVCSRMRQKAVKYPMPRITVTKIVIMRKSSCSFFSLMS
jgi:hypothetical protein